MYVIFSSFPLSSVFSRPRREATSWEYSRIRIKERKDKIANQRERKTVDQDPMSPSFDLEAYLNAVAAKNP